MSRIALIALLTASIGCASPGEDITQDLLTEYEHAVEEVGAATTAYAGAVGAAQDLAAVTAAQATYEQAADDAMDEIKHVLEGFHDCEMRGDADARVTLAHASLTAMHDAIAALEEDHAAHTELSECVTAADAHKTAMEGSLAELEEHHGAWHDNMTCMSHGDDDGHHEEDPH